MVIAGLEADPVQGKDIRVRDSLVVGPGQVVMEEIEAIHAVPCLVVDVTLALVTILSLPVVWVYLASASTQQRKKYSTFSLNMDQLREFKL